MHPLLASGQRLALYLGGWLPMAALFAAAYAGAGGVGIRGSLAVVVLPCIVYAFVCLSAWYVCRAAPLGEAGLSRVLTNHAVASLLASALWLAVWEAWTQVLDGYPAIASSVAAWRAQRPLVFAAGVLLFWLSSMFHYLMIAFERSREAEKRQLGLEVMAREAELKALRAQIDPHFLFNSLNSISALTATSAEGARRMCLRLAEFFRSSVRLGAEDWISIDEEIEMVRQYLDIEKVRCGDRLTARIRMDDGCGACRIPPLILQPLVENAVRHGVQSLVEGGWVRVSVVRRDGRLTLAVENPFDAETAGGAGAGVGLENVRRRVRALFDERGETEVVTTGGRFRVEIRIPCSTENELTDR